MCLSKVCFLMFFIMCLSSNRWLTGINGQKSKNWLEINIPEQGRIVGKEMSLIRTKRIRVFYGIPFAAPPINELRFAPPVFEKLPRWTGIRNATVPKPVCLQTPVDSGPGAVAANDNNEIDNLLRKSIDDDIEMSEDCLYLNVFSTIPRAGGSASGSGNSNGGRMNRLPVVIWLHPGNFVSGQANQYNPYWVVHKKNIVLVTLAYRLNIFGFFTSLDHEATGNFGLMDQVAAFVWVKNKISFFGGDPEKITLIGHDSGAISITLHLISPFTTFYYEKYNKLFTQCIVLSGNSLSTNAVRIVKNINQLQKMVNETAANFNCNRYPTSEMLTCLRNVDQNVLVEFSRNHQWMPTVDQSVTNESLPFIASNPQVSYQTGDVIMVPLLLGFNRMEAAFDILANQPPASDQAFQSSAQLVIANDLDETNSTCDYNLVYDSVLLVYDNLQNKNGSFDDYYREIATFATDKNYAAPTFLLATYILNRYPNVPIYIYRFDSKPASAAIFSQTVPDWVTLPHYYDLLYIWGMPYWYPLDNSLINWDNRDKILSDIIMMFFGNFIKNGSPTNSNVDDYKIVWDPYTTENNNIMLIENHTFVMSNWKNFNYKIYRYWNEFYPKLIESLEQFCKQIDNLENIAYSNAIINTRPISLLLFFVFLLNFIVLLNY